MNFITIIGFCAALFTTISNIPQAIKIIRTKETKGVSATSYLALLIGLVLWVIYGILRDDWPIMVSNGISATICAIVLVLKLISKEKLEEIHDKVHDN
jgi:MtN3 and saliva related transmembrane protein